MTEIRVTYRTALDGELRATITKHLVKYLLFIRGQVPCLYDELLQFVETFQQQQQQKQVHGPNRQWLPVDGGIKKAVRCVEAAEQLLRVQLDVVFSMQVKRVAFVFGSSMISPREAVIVDFGDVEDEVEIVENATSSTTASLENSQALTLSSPPRTREKLLRLCAQKALRALFTHSMEHFSSTLPATKLHIAVLAERQSTRIPGFLPKQQFKLRLPKEKLKGRTHYVTICSDRKQHVQQEDTDPPVSRQFIGHKSEMQPAESNNSCMVWYVLEKPIPGFTEVINTVGGQ